MFHLRPHDVLLSTLLRMRSNPLMLTGTMTRTRSKCSWVLFFLFSLFFFVYHIKAISQKKDKWPNYGDFQNVAFVVNNFRKRRSRSRSRSPGSRKRKSRSKDKDRKKGKKRSKSRERKRSRSRERHRSSSRSKDRSGRYRARKSPM